MKITEYIAMGVPTVAYEHDETRIALDVAFEGEITPQFAALDWEGTL